MPSLGMLRPTGRAKIASLMLAALIAGCSSTSMSDVGVPDGQPCSQRMGPANNYSAPSRSLDILAVSEPNANGAGLIEFAFNLEGMYGSCLALAPNHFVAPSTTVLGHITTMRFGILSGITDTQLNFVLKQMRNAGLFRSVTTERLRRD